MSSMFLGVSFKRFSFYMSVSAGREDLLLLEWFRAGKSSLMWAHAHLQGFVWILACSIQITQTIPETADVLFSWTVQSHVPCTVFIPLWRQKDQKEISKHRRLSACVWIVTRGDICGSKDRNHTSISGNTFTAETLMSVFLRQLLFAASILSPPYTDAETQSLWRQQAASCNLKLQVDENSALSGGRERFVVETDMASCDEQMLRRLWLCDMQTWLRGGCFLHVYCAIMKRLSLSKETHTDAPAHCFFTYSYEMIFEQTVSMKKCV